MNTALGSLMRNRIERRAEPRNWWHDTKRKVRRESVRSNFTRGTWGRATFFAMVPASRYVD